ncbi:hypothetical protein BG011_000157 [Mortierella polycephala]|uniref:Uncharacterized protein n=1 Tax=Mortierella polycephala TaxID=41804 RepID=A0A9P6TW01_9FUNG|nr:hypothetical protein BG011_000157 [Mortierella polycephala]
MTRSSSFNGKGAVVTRQRTSSETPPTYPAALRAAAAAAAAGTSGSSTNSKATHPPSVTRVHKRLSPSFSFFSGAAASLPFKAKPPPRLTLEKSMNAPAESSYNGTTFLSLSGIKPGQVASPRTATVEVTSSSGHAATSKSCTPLTDSKSQCSSTYSATLSSSRSSINKPMTPVKHWADETLVPDLKAAVQELKKIQPGPIKEVPWAVNNSALTPLREPWALVYVQYGDNPKGGRTTNHTSESIPEQQEGGVFRDGQQTSQDILVEVGLSLAPSCMAMVLENSSAGDASRVVTVTKPILVDQAMDSAGGDDVLRTHVDVDLGVEGSDTDSILSPEDSSLGQRSQTQTTNDKELSILRINSKHMLSSVDQSGTRMIPVSQEQAASPLDDDHTRTFGDNRNTSAQRRLAADRAWKTRIRQTVHSEADMPDDVVTVARSIFKVLREFDLVPLDTFEDIHASSAVLEADYESVRSFLLQGVEQAYQFGNHAAAIGLHHSLRVLETSQVLRQLDSSKLIYLLAMPIKHRLEHREERARSRTVWESFAHSWHMRLVTAIERKRESLSTLRIKMYYQTCVRTSRAFEKSLGVVAALSRHNMDTMRRYPSAEAWERDNGLERGWEASGVAPKTERDFTSSWDDYGQYAEPIGESKETDSRRYSGNSGSSLQAQRPAKVRRSSFSAYVDNMSLRSFGSHSFLESNLTHLKEKERATFSSSYNPNHHGASWSNNSMSNPTGSTGSTAEATDVSSDFNMDMREVEAVQRWITDSGIHNFLPGEDNFLRFCMEVESVIQGIGLGGTGIHGAGIPQALNGTIATSLSSSGSDFFVMEVAKYNSQFVTGMGPSEIVVQAKPGAASGVAEFIVNSFKNGHAASSVPSTAGNHLFSSAASSANSISAPGNSNGSSGSGYSTQSSPTATPGSNSSSVGGRSSVALRQILQNNYQNTQETTPVLHDEPTSIYASPPGPTYALYNPPYSAATQGPSSSYSSSMASRGASSIVGSHHPSPPRDMTGFLRKLQLKLAGLLLSEWLDMFGDIEADTWFTEFLDGMSSIKRNHGTAQDDQDDYASTVDPKQVDISDNDQSPCPTESFDSAGESTCPRNSTRSSSSRPPALRPGESQAALHSHGFKVEESATIEYGQNELEDEHQRRQLGFRPASLPQPVVEVRESLKNTSSLSSILNTTDHEVRSERRHSFQVVPAIEVNGKDASAKPRNSGKSLLCPPEVRTFGLEARNPVGPYDLDEAYQSTINRFDQSSSPYQKLGQLHALVQLIAASLSYPDSCTTPFKESDHSRDSQERLEERRSGGPPSSRSGSSTGGDDNTLSPRTFTPGTDAIVNEIERLLRQPDGIRPRHLLRDMQLIATFIPSSILDLRADGKAFWDLTVAVSGLKNEVVQYVVRKGTQYVEVEESSRTSQEAGKTGCRPILQDDEERARMSEAVRLFTIGAKESHPVAQRELAILYMSLPMLPSSSSPSSGYLKAEGSPLLTHTSRIPSPVSIATSRFGKASQRTNTPPPSSPKGTVSSNPFLGKTASIPIKQRTRHQHSGSSSGSSFGSGMLSGLGIITGLGSFTTSSSIGSGGSEGPNSSTASLLQQPTVTEFAEGIHDVDRYYDLQPGRQSGGAACMASHQNSGSLYPHAQHRSRQLPSNSAGPDKFNPENIAAAMHWFTLAAAQGDKFSINYLKHKETAGGMLSDLG